MAYRQKFGAKGEDLAEKYLRDKGLTIVARNCRTPYGEIDLIAREGEALIFVEVKTRSNMEFGYPEDSVGGRKKNRMIQSAEHYIQSSSAEFSDWRIDVISVQMSLTESDSAHIEWFIDAVQ